MKEKDLINQNNNSRSGEDNNNSANTGNGSNNSGNTGNNNNSGNSNGSGSGDYDSPSEDNSGRPQGGTGILFPPKQNGGN